MAYTTQDIRNIVLAGQAGAGKTLLAEALLFKSGAIRAMGEIARGTTICDNHPLEKERQHSLDVALCHLDYQGRRIHLLDTPGYPDLLGRSLAVLPAVESAAVVVNGEAGIEIGTRRMMAAAARRNLCRVIVVNRMDLAGAKLPALLEQLREAFGPSVRPINLPAEGGARVLDCFFTRSGPPTDFSSIEAAHRDIIEQVIEVDETLLERYLAGDESVTGAQLHDAFEKALRDGHLIPVCFTSAQTGAGVAELLELFVKLMPNPFEGNAPPYVKGDSADAAAVDVIPDPRRHVLAHVFKISIDPYAGRIGLFRIHQGAIRTGQPLFVGDQRKPIRLAHLYEMQGKQLTEKPEGIPGDLCAAAKIEELQYDAVLHDSHDEDHDHLREPPPPPAMLGLALDAARTGDEQKLADGLHKLLAEDPSLRLEHHPALNETVLYGLGEMHLQVALERLKRSFNAEVKTRAPSVPYRETITRAADGHHRHKKQTGGAGQFGEVTLRIEPLPRGSGFEFRDAVKGGAIPSQFIPAVEKGVRQTLAAGAVAGYPLQDLRVTVLDGKTHPVDGKEVAFISAGRKAFLEAVSKAGAILLEPMVTLAITAPADSIGNVTADLSGMRGRINQQDVLTGNTAVIEALAPLAELRDYHHRLKSQTAGEGFYTMEFSHYESAPPKVQNDLMASYAHRHKEEAD